MPLRQDPANILKAMDADREDHDDSNITRCDPIPTRSVESTKEECRTKGDNQTPDLSQVRRNGAGLVWRFSMVVDAVMGLLRVVVVLYAARLALSL